jgi:hypothetical protein
MTEPMECEADGKGAVCACSLVRATGGECPFFGPLPTFAEAFPYLVERDHVAEADEIRKQVRG